MLCCGAEEQTGRGEGDAWVMVGGTRRHLEQSAVSETLPIIMFSSQVRVREV